METIATPFEIDFYPVSFVGLVDYTVTALGASNAGGTLPNPAVAVYDSAGNQIAFQDDSFALGNDPLLIFQAPYTGSYTIGVADLTGGVGTYTLVYDQAGVPNLDPADFGTFGS